MLAAAVLFAPAGILAQEAAAPGAQAPAPAETPPPDAWKDVAEFGFVATGGNSETTTLGFKNTLSWSAGPASFELKAGGVRAESTVKTRRAVGDPVSYTVIEESRTDLTAENYFLGGRFDRKVSEHVLWYVGAGWDRNRFAGVDNRTSAAGGLGNLWVQSDRVTFRTDYALTFTRQQDVVPAPDTDETFLGARVSWKYAHKFGAASSFGNDLVIDANLDETSDYRADMVSSVAVAMNARLALKMSLQWLYDHEPALVAVDLFDPGDLTTPIGTVLAELDTLDTVFTASLVLNF
jgi:putative salt-induced outer membrane protein YdiY